MGAKQSKRSMDISGSPVKGEVEGLGHEGRLEKIVEGVVEKVAANGHVEPELQVLYQPDTYTSLYTSSCIHSFPEAMTVRCIPCISMKTGVLLLRQKELNFLN